MALSPLSSSASSSSSSQSSLSSASSLLFSPVPRAPSVIPRWVAASVPERVREEFSHGNRVHSFLLVLLFFIRPSTPLT